MNAESEVVGPPRPAAAAAPAERAARAERAAWVAVAVVFLALAALYTYVIPLRKGPDEPRHEAYVRRLVDKHALPALDAQGNEVDGAIVFHPPGYYLLLAPLYIATRGFGDDVALRAMRATSPLLVGLGLLFFALGLARLYPQRRLLRLTAVAAMAFLPHLQLEAAVLNNDVLAIFLGGFMFWQWARLNDRLPTPRDSLLMGFTLALFVNTKGHGVTLSPLWFVWLWCSFGRGAWARRDFWVAVALGYLPVLALGAPYYLHNMRVYGAPVLIAKGSEPLDGRGQPYAAGQLLREGLLLLPSFWVLVGRGITGLYQSFWTQVGWFPPGAARALYWVTGGWLAAAVVGQARLIAAARRAGQPWWRTWPRAERFAYLAFAIVWLNILAIAVFAHIGWYQGGRYTLPVGYGVFAFLAAGWLALTPAPRAARLLAGLAVAWFAVLNVWCLAHLVNYLVPVYSPEWRPFG